MTKILIDRSVVEEALEALEFANVNHWWGSLTIEKAITALRTALAQQAEPVGTRALIEECLAAFAEELAAWDIDPPLHHVKQAHDKCEAWLAALAQQAEPVEHRVVAGALFDFMGWLTSRRERLVLSSTDDAAPAADAIKDFAEMRGLSMNDAQVKEWQDNITAPPRRKPLTDEEIESCRQQGYEHAGLRSPFDFGKAARAVERAHNITDPQVEARLARHGIPMPGDPK